MSDHVDYCIHCEFPHTLSQQVVDTLTYMTRDADYPFSDPPDHPCFAPEEIFEGERYEGWRTLLQTPRTWITGHYARFFRYSVPGTQWGPGFGDPYILDFRLDVVDDAEGYYMGFLEWLATVSSTRGFIGYSLLQDGGFSEPALLYFRNGQLSRG